MSHDDPIDADEATRLLVRRDQALTVWRTQWISLPANAILSFSMTLTLWKTGLEWSLAIWLGSTIFFVLIGLAAAHVLHSRGIVRSNPNLFMNVFLLISMPRSFIWAALPFIIYQDQMNLVLFVISGICAGAVIQGAVFAKWPIVFVSPILAGAIFQLLRHGSFENNILVVNIIYFYCLLVRSAVNGERTYLEANRLKHEATALADRLRDAHLDALATAQRLHHVANHDDLTGLANRAAFVLAMEAWVARAASEGSHFHLLLLDLDAFKSINDTLGHGAGDAVLVACARVMRQSLRDHDLPARVGGDEFAALIAAASDDEVKMVAERIIAGVERCRPPGEDTARFGISIGGAQYPRDAASAQDMMIRTDIALYAAKRGGRRRFCSFGTALSFSEEMRHLNREPDRAPSNGGGTTNPVAFRATMRHALV